MLNILITKNKLLKAQLPQFWLRDPAVLLIHSLTKFSQHPINKRGLGGRKSMVLVFEKTKFYPGKLNSQNYERDSSLQIWVNLTPGGHKEVFLYSHIFAPLGRLTVRREKAASGGMISGQLQLSQVQTRQDPAHPSEVFKRQEVSFAIWERKPSNSQPWVVSALPQAVLVMAFLSLMFEKNNS